MLDVPCVFFCDFLGLNFLFFVSVVVVDYGRFCFIVACGFHECVVCGGLMGSCSITSYLSSTH